MSDVLDRFRPMFDPRGVVVVGASTHPGKFGFVAAHNILRHGFRGDVFMVNRDGTDVLGRRTFATVDDLPEGRADLAFICTPAAANPAILAACESKGIGAAFIASAGYGEAGPEGRQAEDDLVALCRELGIIMAGPNGQGLISTPASLCAQIVAPYPPRGHIGVASQSGNFVSSFLNYAEHSNVGVSRAVSAGNAAATTIADYLEYFVRDPATAVALTYVEGIKDGRAFFEELQTVASEKPLVLMKGGTTTSGQRAAASHTGALAADDSVFDGMCRQAGVCRAYTVEEAFEAAAVLATQPRPRGPRVVVLSTAGGWGVVTADRIGRSRSLELMSLPDDLRAAIDAKLPPRWSRNNPIDLAGGETRDTLPELMDVVVGHPEVDAMVFIGLGIQSNQGRLEKSGPFYPDHGLGRIVDYHERQDRRYADAAIDASQRYDKPVLIATELSVTHPENAGVARVRERGHLVLPSSQRAVTALEQMYAYARFRQLRDI